MSNDGGDPIDQVCVRLNIFWLQIWKSSEMKPIFKRYRKPNFISYLFLSVSLDKSENELSMKVLKSFLQLILV